jgi:hypothetical protein
VYKSDSWGFENGELRALAQRHQCHRRLSPGCTTADSLWSAAVCGESDRQTLKSLEVKYWSLLNESSTRGVPERPEGARESPCVGNT